MKLYKNVLSIINNNINPRDENSDVFEWNKLFNILPNDNRRTITPKFQTNDKELYLKNGDKMRIPGVLDYTGAKYPFKKEKLVKKHNIGTPIKYHWLKNSKKHKDQVEREKYLNESPVYGEYEPGVYPNFKERGLVSNNKTVRLTDDGITVISSKLGNSKVINEIRKLFPDPVARENLYKILDPKKPLYFLDTRNAKMRVNPKDTLENRLKKVAILYKVFGNNGSVNTTNKDRQYGVIDKNRAFVDPLTNTIMSRDNKPWNVDTALFLELPHLGLIKQGINILSLIGGDLPREYGLNGYETYGTSENQAHEKFARAFEDFVFNPKYSTGKDLGDLITYYDNKAKEEYNLKVALRKSDQLHTISSGMSFKFKSGSKIHIKKKNRGKFTDYCGGNVTQACINRAKSSGNKTLVKRAVFAENSRKWKH